VESEGVDHRLTAILSADGVGYSRLVAEDEGATVRTLRDYGEEIALLADLMLAPALVTLVDSSGSRGSNPKV
jgi:hypothetical protein